MLMPRHMLLSPCHALCRVRAMLRYAMLIHTMLIRHTRYLRDIDITADALPIAAA